MLELIKKELIEIKSLNKEKERLKRSLSKAKNHLQDLEIKKLELHNQLVKEELDVEKVEKLDKEKKEEL